jgi:hypothetical protein
MSLTSGKALPSSEEELSGARVMNYGAWEEGLFNETLAFPLLS